ncbi:hypothetical protein RHGRI_009553 [Rhododendron griersonianum]|uniref:Receptor-like serine/threonine-protein kinase n=1 Tax=Rhododendron griersonianum TaxID=479676 RepID=A0AAV6KFU8_9ERIC|nr:hypothetical protein RHGRI_009553 [Rhododendron griersonianum]
MTTKNFAHPNFILIFSFPLLANALTDTILQGQFVTTSTTITSSGNEFELGFFSPENKNSRRSSYLGIWDKRVSKRQVVWVANWDNPLTDSPANLTIAADGNLVIREGSFSHMLSNKSSSGNTSATLLDSGILVLIDRSSGDIQSYKDSWSQPQLPSHLLGKEFVLGFFSPGNENSTTSSYLGIWYKRASKKTVVWVANRDNPLTDSTAVLTIAADGNLVIVVGRVSYMLSNISSSGNTSATLWDSGNLVLNDRRSGDILWQSFDYHYRYSLARNEGDMSRGCVRKAPLQCGNYSEANEQKDQLLRMSKVRLPDNPIVLSQVRSVGDCESACFSNCSCSAYAYDGNDGCSIWREELMNVLQLTDNDPEGRDFYLRLSASESLSEGKDSRIKRWKWIILAIAVPIALLATVSFFYCLRKRKSQNKGMGLVEERYTKSLNTILQGQLVRASTTITSSGDEFELGFLTQSFSAVLTIAADGNLVIIQGRITYMLSNISSSGNTRATLMDSGNLVLVDGRSGDLLWQSFDYPSDTLLPRMKLGHDKRNGKTWSLLAWKSKEDSGPGGFSIALDPQGTNQFFILKGFEKYWTSGTWKGQIFALIPEMGANFVFKCTYVSNENESYFTYSMRNPSVTARLVMDISGQIQALIWVEAIGEWNLFWDQPREHCDVYAYCGAFGTCYQNPIPFCQCFRGFQPKSAGNWNGGNTSGGCVRKTPLQCGNDSEVNGQKDQFLWISKVRLPDNLIVVSQLRSVGDCELACFSNCSCSAYTYDGNDGCSIWHEELLNVEQLIDDDPEGRDFYLRLAASEFLRKGKDPRIKRRKWIILALAVPMTLLAAVGFFYCLWRQKS